MLRQAQEQAQEKGKVLIMHLCLLNFIFLRQGRFHCQIRTLALPLVSALLLALLVKTRLQNLCNISDPSKRRPTSDGGDQRAAQGPD